MLTSCDCRSSHCLCASPTDSCGHVHNGANITPRPAARPTHHGNTRGGGIAVAHRAQCILLGAEHERTRPTHAHRGDRDNATRRARLAHASSSARTREQPAANCAHNAATAGSDVGGLDSPRGGAEQSAFAAQRAARSQAAAAQRSTSVARKTAARHARGAAGDSRSAPVTTADAATTWHPDATRAATRAQRSAATAMATMDGTPPPAPAATSPPVAHASGGCSHQASAPLTSTHAPVAPGSASSR